MKKYQIKNITIACLAVLLIISLTAWISFFFYKRSQEQSAVFSSNQGTKILANQRNKPTNIQKKETNDAYYYEVHDYERDLIYSWKFKKDGKQKKPLEESLNIDYDLRLSLDAVTKDTMTIEEKVSQNKLIVTFDYHGALPEEATVKINVANKFTNGEDLYLYYYNPELNQIEYIEKDVTVKDGYVEFTINHCSDYFLTAAVVNDAVNNPKSVNYIIMGLLVVVFILIAITLKQSKK